jgi:hypothetical protein
MIFTILLVVMLTTACLIAVQWGGKEEQLVAAAFVVATLASNAANVSLYSRTETGILFIDIALLAGLMVVALRSDRFWPMYATAFQLVAVTVHVASMTEQGSFAWAYAVALTFWTYPVLLALMAGTWLEARFRPDSGGFARG